MKYQLLNHWIVYIGNQPANWSIRQTRKASIEAFLEGSKLNWNERKRYNWHIHKVHIDLCILN